MNYQIINSTIYIFKSTNLLDVSKCIFERIFVILTGYIVGKVGYHIRGILK